MKLLKIVAKNFKILMRSKASAFVVIIGPLLIIGLISLALSNTQDYSLTIGVISHGGDLSDQFISELKDAGYSVVNYNSMDECVEHVKTQTTNICVGLPENFKVEENKTNHIEFQVDQSRVNIVETVISSVSNTLGGQSEQITLSLTQRLIDSIDYAEEELGKEQTAMNEISNKASSIESDSNSIKSTSKKTALGETGNDFNTVNTKLGNIDSAAAKLQTSTDSMLEDVDVLLDTLDGDENYEDSTEIVNVEDGYDSLSNISNEETAVITNATADIEEILENIENKISSASKDLVAINEKAANVETDVTILKQQADAAKDSITAAQNKINSLEIKSASSIVNPFSIDINPILSTSNKSIFMFPYFLMLVILFVGIMLSSTLVVMEKKSKAAFRTFTTPTNTLFYVIGRYITNLLIVTGQLIIILIAAVSYLKIPLMENFFATFVILFLSISFFLFLGAFIGHVFRSQEGTTIASVSIGSLFLFLSNVVLPVESYPAIMRKIISANPYMLSAELIKESMLFGVKLPALKGGILILLVYLILSIGLVAISQKLSYVRLFNSFSSKKILRRPHIRSDNAFVTEEGIVLKSKVDLYKALWKMPEEEYKLYANKQNNELVLWIRDAFKDRKLARMMKRAESKELAIRALEINVGVDEVDRKKVKKNVKEHIKNKMMSLLGLFLVLTSRFRKD